MSFAEEKPSFISPLYNPSFYQSAEDSLTLETAQLLFLPKNDFRLSYLNGIVAGVAAANAVLCVDSNRDISNINNISCALLNGASPAGLQYVSSVTPGFATASKALIVDANRDIAGIKKVSCSHSSPYTAWEASQSTAQFALQLNSIASFSSMGTTSAHGFAIMTANTNRLTVSDSGVVNVIGTLQLNGVNLTPSDTTLISGITAGTATASKALIVDSNRSISNINSIGCTDLTIGGVGFSNVHVNYLTGLTGGTAAASKALVLDSSRNISNINSLSTGILLLGGVSLTGSSASLISGIANGSVSAGKAVVVDGNLDISGFRSMYFNNSTAYTPLTLSQGSGVSVALQLNSDGYSYWGPTSAHGFALQTSNTGALFIASNGNISIGSNSTGTYKCNVVGALNCSQLYIGGVQFNPSASTLTSVLVDKIALNQNTISTTKWYAFDNSTTPQTLLRFDTSGVTSDGVGSIVAETSLGSLSVQQKWDRSSSSINLIQQCWVNDYRSSSYRQQLALRCNGGTTGSVDWQWVDTSSTSSTNTMTFRAGSTSATPALFMNLGTRVMAINNTSADTYAQLDVNGVIRGRSNLWLSSTTGIDLTNISERPIVALDSSMSGSSNKVMIIGKSLSNFNSGLIKYSHVSDGGLNRLQLGFYGYDALLTLNAGGRIGIQNASPRCPLEVSGTDTLTFGAGGTAYDLRQHLLSSAPITSTVVASSTGPYFLNGVSAIFNGIIFTQSIWAQSDRRLKENIHPIRIDIERYMRLKPSSYSYKSDKAKRTKMGLIAQEVIDVAGELVELIPNPAMEDGIQLNIDYQQLSVANLSIIQQLVKKIRQLEAKLEDV